MKKRIGILTAGGDCPGLNATIRGAAKALYQRMGNQMEIVGVRNGFAGLINCESVEMEEMDFSNLLTRGGTILGTRRTPFKEMKLVDESGVHKVDKMVRNYKKMGLDALLCLGGNGTHKTAHLLSEEGLHIVGLPKTIDNDIWGTDVTFGFHTAVDIATEVIDRIHTTASSHHRVMVIELMGNKAGWLTLFSGVAGGADIVLIPEMPYSPDEVMEAVERRNASGKSFSIVAVAEGCYDTHEAKMKRKEWMANRQKEHCTRVSERLAQQIEAKTGFETRVAVPGHIQRGGTPSAYDRLLSTMFGTYAAQLVENEQYGLTVAMKNNSVVSNPLSEVAGKTKLVTPHCDLINVARRMGISLG